MQCTALRALSRVALLGATILATSARAETSTLIDGNDGVLPLPTGQYVTPTPLPGWTQQFLNPRLDTTNNPNYAGFVAGEAVRAQLSPDGHTLAVVTAGQNSLNDRTGATDVANSTQYIFIYDVSGANAANPAFVQAIKQPNAHVGLVWAGNTTLYAAGGADDRVYVYARTGTQFAQTAAIDLGHGETAPFAGTGKGVGLFVEPNASGLALSADGPRSSSSITITTPSASSTRRPRGSATSTICAPISPITRAPAALPAANTRSRSPSRATA